MKAWALFLWLRKEFRYLRRTTLHALNCFT